MPAPEVRPEFGEGGAAALVQATHEQHVDRTIDGRRHCLHRRHTAEAEPFDRKTCAAECSGALITDVQRQQAATAGVYGQPEPRRSRLFGVDADTGRRGALQVVAWCRGQLEELVWGHDQIDGAIGVRESVVDQLDLAAGQLGGLGNPAGDVAHELVAARGDEHSDCGHALLAPCDHAPRLARGSAEFAQRPPQHARLVGMVEALAQHVAHDRATADHSWQVGDEAANLVTSLQRLRSQLVDLGAHHLDAVTQFGVLGTEMVEFLGRHRGKDTPGMCTRSRSPEQRP